MLGSVKFTLYKESSSLSLRSVIKAYSLLAFTAEFFSLLPLTSTGSHILAILSSRGPSLATSSITWLVNCFTSLESLFIPYNAVHEFLDRYQNLKTSLYNWVQTHNHCTEIALILHGTYLAYGYNNTLIEGFRSLEIQSEQHRHPS